VTALVFAAPVSAAPEGGPQDTANLIKQLQLQIQKLQDSVDDLGKRLNDAPTEGSVDTQIRKALAAPAADIYALRQHVEQLQRELNNLRSGKPVIRSSAYSPSGPTPINGVGRIRLVNTYPTQMTVVINERSYRLEPGADRIIDKQPAGTFMYQVLGVQPDLLVRNLAANETYTIMVYPR
jgi:hypothetical protein